MRSLVRNKQNFYYALSTGKTEITDEYGNATGQYTITYSSPVLMKANISAAKDNINQQFYGLISDYSKTIVTNDLSCPIQKDSILWVDKAPYTTIVVEGVETQVLTTHNYIVVKIAKSINSLTIAIKEVEVS